MEPLTFFKCLSDETRLRILTLVFREQSLCVCELTTALNESQPKVSRHLAQLRGCGLLQDSRQGQWIFYRIADDLPAWAVTILTATAAEDSEQGASDTMRLRQMENRPVRKKRSCCS